MKAEAKKSSNIPNPPLDTQHTGTGIEAGRDGDTPTVPVVSNGEVHTAIDAATLSTDTDSLLSALDEDRPRPAAIPQTITTPGQPWTVRVLEGSGTVMRGLSLDERLGRILLSIVLAVLLWFYVTGLENPSQATIFRGLQLEVRGLQQNLKIVNTDPLPTIDVSFQAPQNVLSSLSSTDIHPYIDLTSLAAGVHRVPVVVDFNGNIANTINNLTISPPNYQVQLEVQASETFTVETSVIGTPAFGYGAEQAQVEPSQVTVTGSESSINRIARVVVTVDIDQKAATQRGFNIPVALDSSDQPIQGLIINPPTVQVTVPIKLLLSNRLVPVRVPISGNPAPGYSVNDIKIDPTNVLICCAPGNILEDIDSVSTEPVSISGTVSTIIANPGLILPAGVQLYPGQSSTITVTVSVRTFDTTWQLSVSPVVQGLADGYSSVLSPTSLDLTLAGTFAQFQALTPDDVKASINAANLGGGTYEVTPNVTFPQGIRLVSSNPPTVTLSIIPPTPVPPTPTNTPTNTPTPTHTLTPNPELTATPTPSITNTPVNTPTAVATPIPTFQPSIPPTPTNSGQPGTATPANTPAPPPLPTSTATIAPTSTVTPTTGIVATPTPDTE